MLAVARLAFLPDGLAAQRPGADSAAAGAAARPTLHAARLVGRVVLDGRLDEPAWQRAPAARRFTQSYPNPGKPPTDSMTVRVLYDDEALYVGVRMFDAHPDSIAAQLARRDATGIYSDWLHVIIDSYHDRRTAFRFSVNPRGVEKDVYTYSDGNEDVNWDAVWQVATRIDSLGWVAEYRIPLSQLRYGHAPATGAREWGFQVMRDVARRNERDSWAPWTPNSPGFVSVFGTLTGLDSLAQPRRLEVMPYASSKLTSTPPPPPARSSPFYEHEDFQPSVGGDVRYGLGGALTLTATVNPDFGQVEVDPAVVNLSAFETFFPEKRPFFLEGSDVFDFGQVRTQNDFGSQYFLYSRRIGRPPERGLFRGMTLGARTVTAADAPDQTTIAGAAKVTGRSGPWTLGVLDAVTTEEQGRVALGAGADSTLPVEPRTNYFAGRLRRDFRAGQTVVGGMLTGTVRDMSDPAFRPLLPSRAGFGGVDFEHAWDNRRFYLSGFLAGTRVDGDQAAIAGLQTNSARYFQRPDADYLSFDPTRSSLTGHMGELALQQTGAWFGSLAVKESSPGFEINDLGFQGRTDFQALSALYGHQTIQATRHVQSATTFAYANLTRNFGGDVIYAGLSGRGSATFRNFWGAGAGLTYNPAYYDDRLTRGGPLARVPRSWSANLGINTDSRRLVTLSANASYTRDASGGSSLQESLGVDARPASNVHVSFAPTLTTSRSTSQYVTATGDPLATATYGARYVFSNLRQTTLSLDTRVEWTLTTTLSLQAYIQPFVSAGRFTDYKEFTTPRGYDFAVYGRDRGTITYDPASDVYTVDPDGAGPDNTLIRFGNPTFNARALHGNAVLRWEYRPGSSLYLVWQQQRSGFAPIGDFDGSRDVGAIFRTQPTNVFLIKATYWMGL